MIDGILASRLQEYTDVSISLHQGARTKSFTNSPDGWRHLRLADCPKDPTGSRLSGSTGRYLGIACALYEADHVVSIINRPDLTSCAPSWVATRLMGSMSQFVSIVNCWALAVGTTLEAHRRWVRQTRIWHHRGLTEWKNRKNSGCRRRPALADATIRTSRASSSGRQSHRTDDRQ